MLTWVLPIHLWLFLCLLEISDSSRHLHWQVDSSILKLHGLLVLLPFFKEERNQALLLLIAWQKPSSLLGFWSVSHWWDEVLLILFFFFSMALIDIFVSDEVYHSTLGSWSKILSASFPNVVGRATRAWNSTQPSMMYVICLWFGMSWLSPKHASLETCQSS